MMQSLAAERKLQNQNSSKPCYCSFFGKCFTHSSLKRNGVVVLSGDRICEILLVNGFYILLHVIC